MTDLISVIVPVYNREKSIVKCVDSICCQSYKNLEIILVDDCSSDNSLSICKELGQKDNRIRVIHQEENKGVSEARNLGLKNANGDYIGFVDSDDTIEPEMYQTMLETIKETDTDICVCQIRLIDKVDTDPRSIYDNPYEGIYDDSYDMIRILYDGCKSAYKATLIQSVLNKLYKRDVILKCCFKGNFGEDCYINNQIFSQKVKISIIPDELYNYLYTSNSNSLSHNITQSQLLIFLDLLKERVDRYEDDYIKNHAMIEYCDRYRSIITSLIIDKDSTQAYQTNYRNYMARIIHNKNRIPFRELVKMLIVYVNPDIYKWIYSIRKLS
ncbi:MAG: glycosyltransferase family 2 protein [Erysipelotrichaceae bacterium]|nr:glycosyltransferase family 2 protein [Erysipelotrichaceae bacterium]